MAVLVTRALTFWYMMCIQDLVVMEATQQSLTELGFLMFPAMAASKEIARLQ